MANIIRLRRRASGGSAGAPSSLKTTEPAYNETDDILYLGFGDDGSGNATSIKAVAGSGAFVDKTTSQTVGGTKTFSNAPLISESLSTSESSTKAAYTSWVQSLVDSKLTGLRWKEPAVVATQSNVTVSNPGTATIDGVSLTSGDRVLLKAQTAGAENGIYVFNGSGVAMTRATDADTAAELKGATIIVLQGTDADKQWTQTVDTITLNTTALTWTQIGGGTGGGVTSVTNLGSGQGVGSGVVGSTLNLRSIIGSGNIQAAQNTNDITLTLTGTVAYANGGTGADLSSLTNGDLLKKGASALTTAVAGTDYLSPSSTIDGGTF